MIRHVRETCRAMGGGFGFMMIALIPSAGAQDAPHPNERIYEYRVADYRLQPGWKTYPQGTDRALWMCFDDKARREMSCAATREALTEYRFIFRIDPDKQPRAG